MTLDEYQEKTEKFVSPSAQYGERVFGLFAEAGEVAAVFQKVHRGDYDEDTANDKMKKELGDLLWYLARLTADNGWKLSDVALVNLEKLQDRLERNKIHGDGDDR